MRPAATVGAAATARVGVDTATEVHDCQPVQSPSEPRPSCPWPSAPKHLLPLGYVTQPCRLPIAAEESPVGVPAMTVPVVMPNPQQKRVSATVIAQIRSLVGSTTPSTATGRLEMSVARIGAVVLATDVLPFPSSPVLPVPQHQIRVSPRTQYAPEAWVI